MFQSVYFHETWEIYSIMLLLMVDIYAVECKEATPTTNISLRKVL